MKSLIALILTIVWMVIYFINRTDTALIGSVIWNAAFFIISTIESNEEKDS